MSNKYNSPHSENAMKIYKQLYFAKNETDIKQVHERVANFIGNNNEQIEIFLNILDENIFRPNTPCLIHAGVKEKHFYNNNLAACFTVPLSDSMDSIIELWKICSLIYASGAGAGINVTHLREKGSPLSSSGEASGPCKYLEVLDIVAETVKAGGRNRRAGNMGVFNYNHPDVFDIIEIKNSGKLKTFNLSMMVDDGFMICVSRLTDSPKENEYIIKSVSPNPLMKGKTKDIDGVKLWKNTIHNAWKTGDPGLIFYDTINKFNSFPSKGNIDVVNVCGEIALREGSTCNLGSINVSKFFELGCFNWKKFKEVISYGVNFLDNVIDKTSFIHPVFEKTMKEDRPIGLGIMGFADLMVMLEIEYGSPECLTFMNELCKTLTLEAIRASIQMCKPSFRGQEIKEPIFIPKEDKDHFDSLLIHYGCDADDILNFRQYGIRNSTWTCIAPTGSISISADCSYSFEPLTAIVWEKKLAEKKETMKFINPQFEQWLDSQYSRNTINNKEELLQDIIYNHGSVQNLLWVPENIQKIFKVAHDIDPINKIKLQGTAQRWISLAISSTCNLPNSATEEDVEQIYIEAWKARLKGITVYRDGCKENQPMNFGEIKKNKDIDNAFEVIDKGLEKEWDKKSIIKTETQQNIEMGEQIIKEHKNLVGEQFGKLTVIESNKIERPIKRSGDTYEIETSHGRLYLTINKTIDGRPLEVFMRLGKQGSLENLLCDTISRLISKNFQIGTNPKEIISILRGVKEEKFFFKLDKCDEKSIGAESIIDAVGIIIDQFYRENLIVEQWLKKPIKGTENINTLAGGKIPVGIIEKLTIPKSLQEKKVVESCPDNLCPKCNQYTIEHTTGCRSGQCTNPECFWTSC